MMAKVPRFLLCPPADNRKAETFIIHTRPPRFVGKVVQKEDSYRVYVADEWEPATEEELREICIKMSSWYYYKYIVDNAPCH